MTDHSYTAGPMIIRVAAGYILRESCGCETLVTATERREWTCAGHGRGNPLGDAAPRTGPLVVPPCSCGHEHTRD